MLGAYIRCYILGVTEGKFCSQLQFIAHWQCLYVHKYHQNSDLQLSTTAAAANGTDVFAVAEIVPVPAETCHGGPGIEKIRFYKVANCN